nr:ABC transporter ATP-binding protein [Bacteroidota bacterium]
MVALKVVNVSKRYSGHQALTKVSIDVPKGSIFGLLGPNGAGKTSLIRIINNITAPDEGQVYINGMKLAQEHVSKIGYLPEERGLYKKMKVGEQALYLAQLKGLSKSEALQSLKIWFDKFDIGSWWNKKVEELSKGMQQKVQFIVTVIHNPDLLIFDEPFSGFDPINVNLLKEEILQIKNRGGTIIFSTHNMASVEELCDHIALIDNSKKILDGKMSEIKEMYKEHIYELVYVTSDLSLNDKLPPGYNLITENQDNGLSKARIKLPGNVSPNELLNWAIGLVEVHAFTEILPSMNDIFISKVQQTKSHL